MRRAFYHMGDMLLRALRLLAMLPTRPLEFWDRVCAIVDTRLDRLRARPTYATEPWDRAVAEVGRRFAVDAPALLAEARPLEEELARAIDAIRETAPYPLGACGDFRLGRFCYLVCRALRPATVVETGVLYGVTSSFILSALEANGTGMLHSVDLPPARRGSEDYVGRLVPSPLRARWALHRGTSRRLLPRLLPTLPRVGVFVHDSLHTYRNMRREFETVAPFLAARSALVSDDVHENAAFLDWMRRDGHGYAAAVPEEGKPGLFGVTLCDKRP